MQGHSTNIAVLDLPEAREDVLKSPYYSSDMAPVPAEGRKWGARDLAALWISMSACITTYTLASTLIAGGMNWWQAVLTIFLGNTIVLIPMVLNAHAGTKYGIPFPVYCRASFGIRGANVPALLRALVACGWFGIQTWIGGWAIYKILEIYFPAWKSLENIRGLGINPPQVACFLFFWAVNIFVIYRGIESIRFLLNIKAPLLIALGLALLAWAIAEAGGFGPILSQPSQFVVGGPKAGQFWFFFIPALTGAIGYWATLSLNIPDFTRYTYSQRDQAVGQALGLPLTMALYSFIGVAVTSATIVIFRPPAALGASAVGLGATLQDTGPLPAAAALIAGDATYGKGIWDPVDVVSRFTNPFVLVVALFALTLATLATNIAANVVSPANDFAHLWPRRISFRTGGLITGVIGILMQPWHLYNDPRGYIFKWLIAYSSLLGAVGGVLIADYFVIRKTRLDPAGLYRKEGPYWYTGGINPIGIVALVAGIAPCVPGFLAQVELVEVTAVWHEMYNYAWFISFGVSFVTYLALMVAAGRRYGAVMAPYDSGRRSR
jgi:NCS1 family nucleobase:cation symporter-1